MVPTIQTDEWKRYRWVALLSAIVFLVIQIFPMASGQSMDSEEYVQVLKKQEAEKLAIDFAAAQFHLPASSARTVHQSDSLFYGYLSKSNLITDYDHKYGLLFPTDTYQTEMVLGGMYTAYVYTHMQTGRVVGWHVLDAEPAEMSTEDAAAKAAEQGVSQSALREGIQGQNGEIVFHPEGYSIGDSSLKIAVANGYLEGANAVVTEYKPAFVVPDGYESYVVEQKKLASNLSSYGFLLMSGVLFILAIVFSILYAKHTSFRRGLVISAIFLVFYLLNNYNTTNGVRATIGETLNADVYVVIMSVISTIMSVLLGLSVYFSLVAGDGMWRARQKALWYKFKEHGYGDYVWRSVGLGYLFAIIILGIQSIVLMALQLITGAWSTTDVSQSNYNMISPLLLPMMAWCAAISEEAVYRMFGIALVERLLKNRFIAILIPTVIWAFGHVSYPIFPSTTRLFELIIIGFVFAAIFLRYGFVTAVFTHAIFDTALMSSSLILMGGAANIIVGLLYLVLPVIIAWLIRWRHRTKTNRGRQLPA